MRRLRFSFVFVTALVSMSAFKATADQPASAQNKVVVAAPSPDAVPPLTLTTKPRKDAAELADPVPDLMKRVYQSWLPGLRLTVAPFVRSGSPDAVANGNAVQLKPKLPESTAPLAPLDLPAKPPL